jgi:hypothetical protein
VQQHLRHRVQPERDRVGRQPGRRPQQRVRPRPGGRHRRARHLPGEARRLAAHRCRLPARDIAGDRAGTPGRRRSRTGFPFHTVDIQ